MTQIPTAFSEMIGWLKPLCRFNKLEDFVVCDYNASQNNLRRLRLKIFTKDHQYSISARLPEVKDDGRPLKKGQKREVVNDGYLGCIAQTRKPRAGEDWNRGNALADGDYSKETFDKIVRNVLAYELVKVAKPKHSGAYLDKNGNLQPSNDSSLERNSVLKEVEYPKSKGLANKDATSFRIVQNLLPKQKVGNDVGFRRGRKHYKVTRDE